MLIEVEDRLGGKLTETNRADDGRPPLAAELDQRASTLASGSKQDRDVPGFGDW